MGNFHRAANFINKQFCCLKHSVSYTVCTKHIQNRCTTECKGLALLPEQLLIYYYLCRRCAQSSAVEVEELIFFLGFDELPYKSG